MGLIAELIDCVRIHWAVWQRRHKPFSWDEYADLICELRKTRPDDPDIQRINAIVEMDLRRLYGRRPYDA